MKIKSAMGAALLATFISSSATVASTGINQQAVTQSTAALAEYDQTLPPVGFVKFCAANAASCRAKGVFSSFAPKPVEMTPERWTQIYQVNMSINARIKPVSDQALYDEPERWTYPQSAGDCEDYALLKQRELLGLGFEQGNLRMTVVLDEHNEGHAVLTVSTAQGDYVLDNRRNDILLWKETKYTFLKRQSAEDPKRWVALIKAPAVAAPSVASAQQR